MISKAKFRRASSQFYTEIIRIVKLKLMMEEIKEKSNTSKQLNKDFAILEASGGPLVPGSIANQYGDNKLSTKSAKRRDFTNSNRNDLENKDNEWREDSNDESEMLSGIKEENIMK